MQKEIAQEEILLRQEEENLKSVQVALNELSQTLETIKFQGEQARIQEQGLYLAYQQTCQQVEELETLLELQEKELNNLRGGDWQTEKEKCQERLAVISTESKSWSLRLKKLSPIKNAIPGNVTKACRIKFTQRTSSQNRNDRAKTLRSCRY